MWRLLAALGVLGLALAARPTTAGASLIVDQQCACSGVGSYNSTPHGGHFGQEFTPTLNSVQGVQLFVDATSSPGSALTVNIRQGAAGETFAQILTAPILGTGTALVPGAFSGFFEVDLASAVSLTPGPGHLYIIDATDSDTSSFFNVVANTDTTRYAGGRGFVDEGVAGGDPFKVHENTSNGGLILWFQEGPLSTPPTVPEPTSLLLLSTGLTMCAGVAWRRHRRL